MKTRLFVAWAVWAVSCVLCEGLLAQTANTEASTAEVRDADLAEWIDQLNADRFAERQSASEKLSAAGTRAIPALIEAAENGTPEAAARAVSILGDHFAAGDAATKEAAKSALEKLADGKNSVAARRAKAALETAQSPQQVQVNPRVLPLRIFGNRGIQIQAGQIQGGQIQIQVAQNNGIQRRVAITNNNGVKQVDAEEDGRKVKIKDDPTNGIEMEVTETINGKPTTKKYQSKNADDLKKNHPEAHKLYEKYTGQIQGAGAGANNAARRSAAVRIEVLQRLVDSLHRSIDQLEKKLDKERANSLRQHLEQAKKELDLAKKNLADAEREQKPAAEPRARE